MVPEVKTIIRLGGRKESAMNTDPKYQCPLGHIETICAGTPKSTAYDYAKHWCTKCKRFFYIHVDTGSRVFTDEVDDSTQEAFDSNLCLEKGFSHGKNGIVECKEHF